MLQGEHSAILLTFIKIPFAIKTFVLCIFVWPLKVGFTVEMNWQLLLSFVSTTIVCLTDAQKPFLGKQQYTGFAQA